VFPKTKRTVMEEALTISTGFPRDQFLSPTVYHKPFRIIRKYDKILTSKEITSVIRDSSIGILSAILGGIIIYYASKGKL
jgi:hypothetical protein